MNKSWPVWAYLLIIITFFLIAPLAYVISLEKRELYSYVITEPMIVTDYQVCKHTIVNLKGVNTGHKLQTTNYYYKRFNFRVGDEITSRTYTWTCSEVKGLFYADTIYQFNINLSDLESN